MPVLFMDADAQDYRSTGETTIPAGETAAPIEIAVVDDADIEPARERFVVALDEPQTANVGLSRRARATVAIQEGVCDRTPAVRDALARNWRDCRWPRPADLARIPALALAARDIDALGFATTVRFEVRVEFHWPHNPSRGWRSILGNPTPNAEASSGAPASPAPPPTARQ